ncbi:MAG: hypothetical protein K2X38_08720 [Gemmataceae bacterium]|nr:hypothetical protein [Gemmataceae bacterium]
MHAENNNSELASLVAQAIGGPIGREQVKALLGRVAFMIGVIAPMTSTKLDDLAAAVLSRAAENGQIVDAIYDLIATAVGDQPGNQPVIMRAEGT